MEETHSTCICWDLTDLAPFLRRCRKISLKDATRVSLIIIHEPVAAKYAMIIQIILLFDPLPC